MYEVEAKYQLHDAAAFAAALQSHGYVQVSKKTERDRYLAHPTTDYAATDEALRIREITGDGETTQSVTYKGPRETGAIKSREEIDIATRWSDATGTLFERLGFTTVAVVTKRRTIWERTEADEPARDGETWTATLDIVEGVGTYAEIERVVAPGTARDAVQQAVLAHGRLLGLNDDALERRSYLELLLTGRGIDPSQALDQT